MLFHVKSFDQFKYHFSSKNQVQQQCTRASNVDVISVQITEIINTWLWCLAGLMESEGNARQQNDQSQVLCNHQYIPANMKHSLTVVLMLHQRRRRWANIETTVVHCLVFAGIRVCSRFSYNCWLL